MAQIKISIQNSSTALTNTQVSAVIPALQMQVSRDFAPIWGVDADLDFVPTGEQPPPGHWLLVVLDNSDVAGDLGYHDLTAEGLPMGKIFAGTDIYYGSSWTVTASHELLEMLGDPDINLYAMSMSGFDVNQNTVGRLYAYEVSDPCEADRDGYNITIDGVTTLVSDFVFPAWFEGSRATSSTQFDFQNRIINPFELLPGGYSSLYDMTGGTGWQQISVAIPQVAGSGNSARAPIGSRRERRRTPRNQWQRNSPDAWKRKPRA